jgi:hypothetical protein
VRQTETHLQAACYEWVLRLQPTHPELRCFTAFEHKFRGARQGALMKRLGARRGWPDLLLAVARRGYHGLWIELKAPGRTATPDQRAVHALLEQQGYRVRVIDTLGAFIEEITEYCGWRDAARVAPGHGGTEARSAAGAASGHA